LLASQPSGPPDLALALTCTATIAYLVANLLPLMQLSVEGRVASTTITGGAYQMWMQGQPMTAILVAFCALIAPGGYLLLMFTLLLAARRSYTPQWVAGMLRWVKHLRVWSMGEVMMVGILVALVKIAELATVTPGVGIYAFGSLVLLFPSIMLTFDVHEVWRTIEWVDGQTRADTPDLGPQR
jgi:paraquat-inducible protein A